MVFKREVKKGESVVSIIGKSCAIEGTLKCTGHLIVEGSIRGTLEADSVFLEKGCKVMATLKASSVTIAGQFEGDIEVFNTLTLLESAHVKGTILYNTLIIEAGGTFNGRATWIGAGKPSDTSGEECVS